MNGTFQQVVTSALGNTFALMLDGGIYLRRRGTAQHLPEAQRGYEWIPVARLDGEISHICIAHPDNLMAVTTEHRCYEYLQTPAGNRWVEIPGLDLPEASVSQHELVRTIEAHPGFCEPFALTPGLYLLHPPQIAPVVQRQQGLSWLPMQVRDNKFSLVTAASVRLSGLLDVVEIYRA
jgi:hypothetical protein